MPQQTMYPTILTAHSLARWIVLTSLLFSILCGYHGWYSKRKFTSIDNAARRWTTGLVHIQLTLGLWLYFISPIIDYFLHHYKDAVHQRQIRFFGMEHSLMMLVAIIIITIGSAKANRKPADNEKFQTMAIWFTTGLLIILANVPWPFSPLVNRPYFRPF